MKPNLMALDRHGTVESRHAGRWLGPGWQARHVLVCNIPVSRWAFVRPDRLRTFVLFVCAKLKRTWHRPENLLPCPTHAGGTQNPAKVVGYILLYTLLVEASLNPNRPLAHMPKRAMSLRTCWHSKPRAAKCWHTGCPAGGWSSTPRLAATPTAPTGPPAAGARPTALVVVAVPAVPDVLVA